MRRILLITLVLLSMSVCMSAQDADRFKAIEDEITRLSNDVPGLNEELDMSVSNVTLHEFLRGLGSANGVNISVSPALNNVVSNNFSNVTVADVIIFLTKKYDLQVEFIGNIISFSKYVPPVEVEADDLPQGLIINYVEEDSLIGFDFNEDSLAKVVREITNITNQNIVLAPGLGEKKVSGYIKNMPFHKAMENLAFANDIHVRKEDGVYVFEQGEKKVAVADNKGKKGGRPSAQQDNRGQQQDQGDLFSVDLDEDGLLDIKAIDMPIKDIINAVSAVAEKDYFLFAEPKGSATLMLDNCSYEVFLSYLLNGTDFTYKVEDDIYLIGERNTERLRATRVVQLQNRTIEKIVEYIPPELQQDLEINEFPDMNSLILSGSHLQINELEHFIHEIDQVVPVIMIEVIIAEVSRSRTTTTGIRAGYGGDEPIQSGGTLAPEVNVNMNSETLNDIISRFNGFGIFNLGKVTKSFYMSLRTLEQQGVVNTRSTPKLATLNGNEASLSIGETQYYLELSSNVMGGVNPQTIVGQQWKSVNADLSLTIVPFVSGDEQITLNVQVQQSDFTPRVSNEAPPGSVTRNFQSLIRVKNEEMVILGGIEQETDSNVGEGAPGLSRVPVIKWFFSSRTKEKSKSRLNIFIKPTVIY